MRQNNPLLAQGDAGGQIENLPVNLELDLLYSYDGAEGKTLTNFDCGDANLLLVYFDPYSPLQSNNSIPAIIYRQNGSQIVSAALDYNFLTVLTFLPTGIFSQLAQQFEPTYGTNNPTENNERMVIRRIYSIKGFEAEVTSGSVSGGQNVAGYVGEITYFADNILRKNHVWADGSPVDAAQWPDLAYYAATAGWPQNEAGQYLTPDLRGRFLLGASTEHEVGSTGGEETHTLTVEEMPEHYHDKIFAHDLSDDIAASVGNDASPGSGRRDITFSNARTFYTSKTGGSQPHNNMPPFYTASAQIRAMVDTIQVHLTACPYEVGDILQTKNSTLPSERWSGTEWAPIETFLLGASTTHLIGEEGGEEEHTLTVEEMPAHSHGMRLSASAIAGGNGSLPSLSGQVYDAVNTNTGGSQPHNNMPPYTAVYIWERTA